MSTPGCRSRAAADERLRRLDRRDGAGAEPAHQLGGERARAAADVEHPLPAPSTPAKSANRGASGLAYVPMKRS